jgi:hypothetical protein
MRWQPRGNCSAGFPVSPSNKRQRLNTLEDAMRSRLVFVAVLAAATTSATASETVIGGVSINLPVPSGFCELSAGNPADKQMVANVGAVLTKGGHRVAQHVRRLPAAGRLARAQAQLSR